MNNALNEQPHIRRSCRGRLKEQMDVSHIIHIFCQYRAALRNLALKNLDQKDFETSLEDLLDKWDTVLYGAGIIKEVQLSEKSLQMLQKKGTGDGQVQDAEITP